MHARYTVLPMAEQDEFKAFARKLPMFKFWHSITKVPVHAALSY